MDTHDADPEPSHQTGDRRHVLEPTEDWEVLNVRSAGGGFTEDETTNLFLGQS